MSKKKPKKRPKRGSGFSVTLPTEPLAGVSKTTPIMAVIVMESGVKILEYDIKLGGNIEFRVGGETEAYVERVGPAPDSDIFMDASAGNVEAVTVEYEHALAGPQTKILRAGQRLTMQAVVARHWKVTAPHWE